MKLLVVVDMQNDFVRGALGTPEAVGIVEAVQKKVQEWHKEGYKIVYTRDTHHTDYLNTQEGKFLPVEHCLEGTEGWKIIPEVWLPESKVIDKPAFGSLELAEWVASVPQLEEVQLVGLCTDICVISNAMILKARLPELKVSVDASCCAGVTPASHQNALAAMKMCQIVVTE